MQAQPAEIGVDRRGARDDAEALLGETRDGDVGDDAAARVEELRVDDAPGLAIDVRVADALEQRGCARALDRDLAERRHVDQAHAFAQRRGLLGQQVRIGRRRPAEGALLLPRPPPRPSGLVVVGALPAVLGGEDGARVLRALVQRAGAPGPPERVAVERIAQAVVVAIGLARGLGGVARVAVHGAEAPRAVALQVELALARGHELGDRLADAARAAEAVQREAGCDEEARRARELADQRIAVRRHRVGVADELDDARVGQEREALRRALHERREARLVGRHRLAAVIPRHAVDPARDGIVLVAAEQHAAGLGLAVDEVVGIAEAGHVVRQLVPGDGRQRDVLVLDRDRDEPGAGHGGHLRRPHAGGVDDDLGLDPPVLGDDGAHLVPRAELDARHALSRADLRAQLARGVRQRVGRRMRIEVAVARQVDRAVERFRARVRQQAQRLGGRCQLDVEPDRPRARDAALQLAQRLGARCDAHAAHRLEHAELAVQLDAVAAEAHHRGRRIELRHESRRVARRAARQRALVDQDEIAPAGARQVVGHAAAGDAASDDDRAGAIAHVLPPGRSRKAIRRAARKEQTRARRKPGHTR